MNIAVIGAGLIGRKRASNLPLSLKLKLVCDTDETAGKRLAGDFRCNYIKTWHSVIRNPDVHAVIVATTHNCLSPIGEAAIMSGKHVFLEKPGAKNLRGFNKLVAAYRKNPVVVAIGYNHRYHPAVRKAKKLIDSGAFGKILFIRGRYGHGGRLGYEKEWRMNKKLSGGGQLLDQGSHLFDLVNFYLGDDFNEIEGHTGSLYWQAEVEDTAFVFMKTRNNQLVQLSASWVEWKNIFSFEIMLEKGKIQIYGLGGSYGTEKLTVFEMTRKMGPPRTKEFTFSEQDTSWKMELEAFSDRIRKKDCSPVELKRAQFVLETIDKIYKQNQ